MMGQTNLLDFRRFKRFVSENYPKGSTFREVILAEDDLIPPETFLERLVTWLKLLEIETRRARTKS